MTNILKNIEGVLYPNEYDWFPKRKITKNIGDKNRNNLFKSIDKILKQKTNKSQVKYFHNKFIEFFLN